MRELDKSIRWYQESLKALQDYPDFSSQGKQEILSGKLMAACQTNWFANVVAYCELYTAALSKSSRHAQRQKGAILEEAAHILIIQVEKNRSGEHNEAMEDIEKLISKGRALIAFACGQISVENLTRFFPELSIQE